MKTTNAYLAGLCAAGVLIAAAVLALVLGSAFASFDGSPDPAAPAKPLDRVVMDEGALGH